MMFVVAAPPSGEVIRSDFGGVHQKPVELPLVLPGLRRPALVRMASKVHVPRAVTGAEPITGLLAAVNAVQTPLTL